MKVYDPNKPTMGPTRAEKAYKNAKINMRWAVFYVLMAVLLINDDMVWRIITMVMGLLLLVASALCLLAEQYYLHHPDKNTEIKVEP